MITTLTANKPHAPNPAIALWFQFKYHWRGVSDAGRSATMDSSFKVTVNCIAIWILILLVTGCATNFASPIGTWTVRHHVGNDGVEGFSTTTLRMEKNGRFTEVLVMDLFNAPDPEPTTYKGQWRQDKNVIRFQRDDSPATESYVIDPQGLRMTGNVVGINIVLSRKIEEDAQ